MTVHQHVHVLKLQYKMLGLPMLRLKLALFSFFSLAYFLCFSNSVYQCDVDDQVSEAVSSRIPNSILRKICMQCHIVVHDVDPSSHHCT
jgi:hypothetical protein